MNIKELKEHLRLHLLWLAEDKEGSRAHLYGADLSCANLYGANLYGANLSGADLSCANLYGANLSGADLSGADFSCANLHGANLYGASLVNTIYEDKAILSFQFRKHAAYFFGMNEITIGCHKYSIEYWLKNFEEIGKEEKYTDEEIKKYGRFIKGCAKIQKELDEKMEGT
jgi:hypothetical protein